MINDKVLLELKKLIEDNLDPSMFPYCKGNSIRIGYVTIRENKHGFQIYNIKNKTHLGCTFSKTAAVAIAKNIVNGRDYTNRVIELDKVIEKNFNDAKFFSHTLRVTKDEVKREITEMRLDIATSRTAHAKSHLDCMIF